MPSAPVQVQEIKELIVSSLKLTDVTASEIGDDDPLFVEGLGLDSVDALELVLAVEQGYGLKIEDSKVGTTVLASPAALTRFVNERLNGKREHRRSGVARARRGRTARPVVPPQLPAGPATQSTERTATCPRRAAGGDVERTATEQALLAQEDEVEAVRLEVIAGKQSPLAYHLATHQMPPKLFAQHIGIATWRVQSASQARSVRQTRGRTQGAVRSVPRHGTISTRHRPRPARASVLRTAR